MRAASPALSLAWKLEWLIDDIYPQGKDLYDAVLLAEYPAVPLNKIRELMHPDLGSIAEEILPKLAVDWKNFRDEYPGIGDDAEPWLLGLLSALSLR